MSRFKCRGCLKEELETAMYSLKVQATQKLFELTGISVHKDDGKPQHVCLDCFASCVNWNTFKWMVLQSDEQLGREDKMLTTEEKEEQTAEDQLQFLYMEAEDIALEQDDSSGVKDNNKGQVTPTVDKLPAPQKVIPSKAAMSQNNEKVLCTNCTGQWPQSHFVLKHCKWCQLPFNLGCELRIHSQTTHANEMPLRCHQCGDGFMLQINLQNHLNWECNGYVNFNPFPWTCKKCGMGFERKDFLIQHLKSFHPLRSFM